MDRYVLSYDDGACLATWAQDVDRDGRGASLSLKILAAAADESIPRGAASSGLAEAAIEYETPMA